MLGTERQSPARKKNSWAPSIAFKRKINLRACSIPSVENKSHCETPVTVLLELVGCLKCSAMCMQLDLRSFGLCLLFTIGNRDPCDSHRFEYLWCGVFTPLGNIVNFMTGGISFTNFTFHKTKLKDYPSP